MGHELPIQRGHIIITPTPYLALKFKSLSLLLDKAKISRDLGISSFPG